VIDRDLPVSEEFLPAEVASSMFDLSRLPGEKTTDVRIVRIGTYDACPCAGAHVRSTREIGRFRLISWSHEESALRLRFKLDQG